MDRYSTDNVQSFISLIQEVKPKFMTLSSSLDPTGYSPMSRCGSRGQAAVEAQFKGKIDGDVFSVEYEFKQCMRFSTNSKKELLETLRGYGVAEADLAKLKKMTTKEFYGLTCTTVGEDEEEVIISKRQEKDRFTFNAGRLTIKIEADASQRGYNQMHCNLSLDYKEEVEHLLEVLRLGVPEGTTILENMTYRFTSD